MDEILADFIAETRETLESVSGELVAWEADPGNRERLDKIFRFIHTVKGSCGFLDLPRLEKLSHAAEDVLADLRADRRTADRQVVSAVLAVIDRIAELTEALDTGEAVPENDAWLIAALAEQPAVEEVDPAAALAPSEPAVRGRMRSIRISLDLLDRMMNGVSDLVLARNELSRRITTAGSEPELEGALERLSLCIADMRDAITRTRMQRIEKLFGTIPRLVRDLATELGKTVELSVDGGSVELDREMIEAIRDPLTHIIRNALDHGIEPVEERLRAGKPAAGRLRISARQSGNQIVLDVADDGRGIDGDALLGRALSAGVISATKAEGLSRDARLALIFEPGLSTARSVTALSGRGVGMDVVRSNVERIGGVIELASEPGRGLSISIRVPLTLSIIPALAVGAGGQGFAIPQSAIQEIVRENGHSVTVERLGGAEIARIRDQRIPVVRLEAVLALDDVEASEPRSLVVVNPLGGATYAISVAELFDSQDLVIRPACPAIMAAGAYAGMTLPDTGHPMLLLDPAGIAELAHIAALPELEQPRQETADAIDDAREAVSVLLFRDLDGIERGIRLGVVERIEDAAVDQIGFAGGRIRLAIDGRIVPLSAIRELEGDRESIAIMRLSDGHVELAYAIDEVIDIVSMVPDIAPASVAGPVAGVALLDGRQIEMLDPFWLFSDVMGCISPPVVSRPLCVLPDQDDAWTREILRPLVEAAGYRVMFGEPVEPLGDADMVILTDDAGVDASATPASGQVLRLRATLDTADASLGSVYRYDRSALMSVLQQNLAGRGAR